MVIRGVARSAPARLAISLVMGMIVLLLVRLLSTLLLGVLSGIAVMGAVFVLTGVVVLWPMTADSTRYNRGAKTIGPMSRSCSSWQRRSAAWWELSYC